MNLIAQVAEGIVNGLSHARIAAEIELKHGVQVGEAWIARITGADGFEHALAEARARLSAVGGSAATDLGDVVSDAGAVVKEAEAEGAKLMGEGAVEAGTAVGKVENAVSEGTKAVEAEAKKAE